HWGATFFIWPPDPRHPLGTSDTAKVKQWLLDIGFSSADVDNSPSNANRTKIKQIWQNWMSSSLNTTSEMTTLLNSIANSAYPTSVSVATTKAKILRLFKRGATDAPDGERDWRRKFFLKPGGSYPNFGGPITDNNDLFDSSGNWYDPSSSTYVI